MDRFDRQIELLGKEGQRRLSDSRVLIAGLGGLGSAASTYLVAAGVGKLIICDGDVVELSNLNRQIIHWETDVGKEKTKSAVEKLKMMNSEVEIECAGRMERGNAFGLVSKADAVIDALDNFESRYVLNEACIKAGKFFVHGAVEGFEGRVLSVMPKRSACLKCVYPDVKAAPRQIIGVTAGIIGCIQALEVIKYLSGVGETSIGKLLVWDGRSCELNAMKVERKPSCPACGDESED